MLHTWQKQWRNRLKHSCTPKNGSQRLLNSCKMSRSTISPELHGATGAGRRQLDHAGWRHVEPPPEGKEILMATNTLNPTLEQCIEACLQCIRWCSTCVEESLT